MLRASSLISALVGGEDQGPAVPGASAYWPSVEALVDTSFRTV